MKDAAGQAADERKSYRQSDYDLSGNVIIARRVQFKPMLGLFNQEKLVPLRYCPVQIELELVNQQADAVTTEEAEGFTMVQIGTLAISNANVIYLSSIQVFRTNMLLIF